MDPIAQARALINSWLGRDKPQAPLTQPKGDAINTKFGQIPFKGPGLSAKPVQAAEPSYTPSPTPNPTLDTGGFRFAYETMNRNQDYANNGPRPNFQPSQPPSDIAQIIRDIFPDEATAAALVASTENAQFDSNRPDNINTNGSPDRGIFQINRDSFNGLMSRQGDRLKKMGITSFEDMRDPRKNAQVAKMIKEGSQQYNPQTKGWGGWYGWQDTGYDINNDYYSQPKRVDFELKKRGRK